MILWNHYKVYVRVPTLKGYVRVPTLTAVAPDLDFETWESTNAVRRVPHPRHVLVFVARVGNTHPLDAQSP
jgi:hypothetical protein